MHSLLPEYPSLWLNLSAVSSDQLERNSQYDEAFYGA